MNDREMEFVAGFGRTDINNHLRIFNPIIAAILFCLFSSAAMPLYAEIIGDILSGSGKNLYKRGENGEWLPLLQGQKMYLGDSVKTEINGKVKIILIDGSHLTLGAKTVVEIDRFLFSETRREAEIYLLEGKLRTSFSKFSGSTDIRLITPTGVAKIRGTAFLVMNHGEANIFFGEEGRAEISGDGADGGESYLVPDTMIENTRGHTPVKPVHINSGTPLSGARKQLMDAFRLDTFGQWNRDGSLPLILARWNINYGRYLADSGRYNEAQEVFQIAMDLSDAPEILSEAHLQRGSIFSRHLDDKNSALREYMYIIKRYPQMPQLANALFSAGMIYFDIGKRDSAGDLFKRYLRKYPGGKHSSTARLLLHDVSPD